MSKKSNLDKGLRSVNIDFAGQNRTLKFTHPVIGDLEADCNIVLRSMGVVQSGMVFADGIIGSWLGNARILSHAIHHGIGKTLTLEEIDEGIDRYIQDGGKKDDLIRAIIRAYRLATDPSSLVWIERSWKVSDEKTRVLTKAEQDHIEAVEKAIAEAKVKMIPGSPSSESESST